MPGKRESTVGCLLIGQVDGRMDTLRRRLSAHGVDTVVASCGENWLDAVHRGIVAARRKGGACVAADGQCWPAALALGVQLDVDRIALIRPTGITDPGLRQLDGFVRRNLFCCVSDLLWMESPEEDFSRRTMNRVIRRMNNARICRIAPEKNSGAEEDKAIEVAARFLAMGPGAIERRN